MDNPVDNSVQIVESLGETCVPQTCVLWVAGRLSPPTRTVYDHSMWTTESSSTFRPVGKNRGMESLGREVVRLAAPAFGAMVAPSVLLLTEAAFIGAIGTSALAGYAAGAAVFGIASSLSYFLAYASTSVVSRRFGAGQPREAVADGINYITLGLGVGLGVGALIWFGAPTFVGWVGVSDSALANAVDWLRGGVFAAPALMGSMATIGLFRGLQDTRVTLYVTLFVVSVNIALCALFLFGFGMGTFGAGLAMSIAEVSGFAAYLAFLLRYARSVGAPMYPTHLGGVMSAMRVGAPLLWRSTMMRVVFTGVIVVAAKLGTEEVAAFNVSLHFWYVLANLLDAIAIAAQAIIGKRLGASEGHLVHDIVRRLLRWSMLYGVIIGVLTMLSAPFAPALISDDAAVRTLLMQCLLIIGIHQPLAAVVFLLDGVLVGSGDSKFLAFVLTMALLAFLPVAWAVVHFELGVIGLWCAMITFLVTRAVFMLPRASSDAWIVEGATR